MDIETLKSKVATVSADRPEQYGYSAETPERRRAFLLRQQIYDRELQIHQNEPMVIRMAYCLGAYLLEKEIIFEDDTLAGFTFSPAEPSPARLIRLKKPFLPAWTGLSGMTPWTNWSDT